VVPLLLRSVVPDLLGLGRADEPALEDEADARELVLRDRTEVDQSVPFLTVRALLEETAGTLLVCGRRNRIAVAVRNRPPSRHA